jgi:hypothetical protein
MDSAERARLLRERFKPMPTGKRTFGAGLAREQNLCTRERPVRVRYVVLPKPTGRGFVSCGPMQSVKPPLWVATPDKHEVPALALKRRQGEPALVRIAAQLPRKLPRVPLPQ